MEMEAQLSAGKIAARKMNEMVTAVEPFEQELKEMHKCTDR